MRNVIIWGTGKYFDYKIPYLSKEEYDILGVVSKNAEVGKYPIIHKNKLREIAFDKIIIMSEKYMFEILEEIFALNIAAEKIILGVNLPPATASEMRYISEDKHLFLKENGEIVWNNQKIVTCMEDIEEIKKMNRGYLSKEIIRGLPVKPVSYDYGLSEGQSIARYYIDKFVEEHLEHIKGTVMEVGDSRYTKWGKCVEKSLILVLMESFKENEVKGNLETGDGLIQESVDCFILTNVFSSLFDVNAAMENAGKTLREGGKAIVTVPGIAAICRGPYETYGQFWRFTPLSLMRLFKQYIPNAKISMKTYGNVKTSAAFLYGMNVEDLTQEELDYTDSNYPMIIGAFLERE